MTLSYAANFFRTQLMADAPAAASAVTVRDNGIFTQLAFPTYMVIHGHNPARREVVEVTGSGVSGDERTLILGARGLEGSTVAAGSAWANGSRVVAPPLKQTLDDIHNRYVPRTLVDAKGDLLLGSASDTVIRQAVGSNNTILMANSATSSGVQWQTAATAVQQLITTKGDLAVNNGTTAVRLPVGSNNQQLVADSTQATGLRWANGGMQLIGEQILSSTTSLSVASIPATFKALRVYAMMRSDQATTIQTGSTIRLNANATAANYVYHSDVNSSTTATGAQGSAALPLFSNFAATAPADYFTVFTMDIPWYADTSMPFVTASYTSRSPGYSGATGYMHDGSFIFSSGAVAINRIQLVSASGGFIAGSRMAVYGVH